MKYFGEQEMPQCLAHCPLIETCHSTYVSYPEMSGGSSPEEHHAAPGLAGGESIITGCCSFLMRTGNHSVPWGFRPPGSSVCLF